MDSVGAISKRRCNSRSVTGTVLKMYSVCRRGHTDRASDSYVLLSAGGTATPHTPSERPLSVRESSFTSCSSPVRNANSGSSLVTPS